MCSLEVEVKTMATIYVGEAPDPETLADALRSAGHDVSFEKAPRSPGPGELAIIDARTGVTSACRHEINNPLTAVLGFLQLLARRTDLPEDAMDKVEKAYHNGTRVRDLIRKRGEHDA